MRRSLYWTEGRKTSAPGLCTCPWKYSCILSPVSRIECKSLLLKIRLGRIQYIWCDSCEECSLARISTVHVCGELHMHRNKFVVKLISLMKGMHCCWILRISGGVTLGHSILAVSSPSINIPFSVSQIDANWRQGGLLPGEQVSWVLLNYMSGMGVGGSLLQFTAQWKLCVLALSLCSGLPIRSFRVPNV